MIVPSLLHHPYDDMLLRSRFLPLYRVDVRGDIAHKVVETTDSKLSLALHQQDRPLEKEGDQFSDVVSNQDNRVEGRVQ